MATISLKLHQSAFTGNIESMISVDSLLKRTLRHQIAYAEVLEIVLHHLRPAARPNAFRKLSLARKDHLDWLSRTILCFSMLHQIYAQCGTRTKALPAQLQERVSGLWAAHIWPSMRMLIDTYILDDSQPFLSESVNQECAFNSICGILDGCGPSMDALTELSLDSFVEGNEYMLRLLLHYMDRHPTREFVPPFHIADSFRAQQQIEKEPRFFPVFLSYLMLMRKQFREAKRHAKSSQLHEQLCRDFSRILTTVRLCFHPLPPRYPSPIPKTLAFQYPEIIDELLKLWQFLFDNNSFSTVFGHHAFKHCTGLVYSLVEMGGCILMRRALKRHYLQLIAKTCSTVPHRELEMKTIHSAVDYLSRQMVHLSVLTPTLHAWEKVRTSRLLFSRGQHETTMSSLTVTLGIAWRDFSTNCVSREAVLKKYVDVYPAKPICNNSQCPAQSADLAMRCTGCRHAYYCSRACAKQDWKEHRIICGPLAAKHWQDQRDHAFFVFQLHYDLGDPSRILKYYPSAEGENELQCDYTEFPPQFYVHMSLPHSPREELKKLREQCYLRFTATFDGREEIVGVVRQRAIEKEKHVCPDIRRPCARDYDAWRDVFAVQSVALVSRSKE